MMIMNPGTGSNGRSGSEDKEGAVGIGGAIVAAPIAAIAGALTEGDHQNDQKDDQDYLNCNRTVAFCPFLILFCIILLLITSILFKFTFVFSHCVVIRKPDLPPSFLVLGYH